MNRPRTRTSKPSSRFAQEVRADGLVEEMLLPKQVLVVAAIALLLLLRQLVLT
jgi:hypothetical protein